MNPNPFKTGGPLTERDAAVYIERQADDDALFYLQQMKYVLLIEPRQQGKTNLVFRLMRDLALRNVIFAYVDVSTLDRSSQEGWYRTLCHRLLRQWSTFIPRDQWPAIPENFIGWRMFLSKVGLLAKDANRRVVIALDEIGAVTFPASTDFFSVLREIYNSRQNEKVFSQLTFLLVGAFHPRDLIQNDKISPFNIAEHVRLPDFTLEEVRELVSQGHWSDQQITPLAQRIHHWTDGHPYLTQVLCSYLSEKATPADVNLAVSRLHLEDQNHWPFILRRLESNRRWQKYVARIMAGERIKFYPANNRRHAQLELLGIIKTDEEGYCTIRNQIYEILLAFYFPQSKNERLNLNPNLPLQAFAL